MAAPLAEPRVKVPERARIGEPFTIKTLLRHPMDSGHRIGEDDRLIPRLIINRFIATFENEFVFSAIIEPSIAANPYFEFTVRLERSGRFRFLWIEDGGASIAVERSIIVA